MAFAASGALVGIHKDMDVFGVCILGLTTACGGGMVRDVLLGNTPPAAFQNPTDSAVAVVTALILFLSGVRHLLMGNQQRYDLLMLLMDSAGLGIFTVMGVRVAWHCAENPSLYLLVFVGAVTGVGGGLMRDMRLCAVHTVLTVFHACRLRLMWLTVLYFGRKIRSQWRRRFHRSLRWAFRSMFSLP